MGAGFRVFIGLGCEIGKGNWNGASTGMLSSKGEKEINMQILFPNKKNGRMGEIERKKGGKAISESPTGDPRYLRY